jgi:hypothetical protein
MFQKVPNLSESYFNNVNTADSVILSLRNSTPIILENLILAPTGKFFSICRNISVFFFTMRTRLLGDSIRGVFLVSVLYFYLFVKKNYILQIILFVVSI